MPARGDVRHPVAVEVIVLRAVDGRPAYRRRVAALPAGPAPDAAAAALAGVPAGGLVHSTSWRQDARWGFVLTYAALPDPAADRTTAVLLDDLAVAAGTDPVRPTPTRVTIDRVAAHAVRHLALLRRTDPVVATALARCPDLDAAVALADPLPAGRPG